MSKSFKEMFISIVAPVVRNSPEWAMKYTLKSNPYAEYFQLSHEQEMEILRKPRKIEWVKARIWLAETRIACLKTKLWKFFADDVQNSNEFQAIFGGGVSLETTLACKGYTLSLAEIIATCNRDHKYVEQLLKKQPESFTVNVVDKLDCKAQEVLLSLLFAQKNFSKLNELDSFVWKSSKSTSKELARIATSCIGIIINNFRYRPNIEACRLAETPGFEIWKDNADPMVVAEKMTDFWYQNGQYDELYTLVVMLVENSEDAKIIRAKEIVDMLIICQQAKAVEAVKIMIEKGIACPEYLSILSYDTDKEWVEKNIQLCIASKVVSKISKTDLEILPQTLKEQALIALAEDSKISNELFEIASPELKDKLFDILEENAQAKWFEPLLFRNPETGAIDNIKSMRKIGGKIQDLSLKDVEWAKVFAEAQFYDEEHIIKLVQSSLLPAIINFAIKHGLTHEQYTALLMGNSPQLAPQIEKYIKK